ncbi:MAG: hypothetical protein Q9218_003944 [Villophora microphyllina]
MPGGNTHPLRNFTIDGAAIVANGKSKHHVALNDLKNVLNDRLKDSIPWQARPYKAVNVLLLGWERNDMTVDPDIEAIKFFFENTMGYDCDKYLIKGTALAPDINDLLMKMLLTSNFSKPETLLIIMYIGHGWSNSAKKDEDAGAKPLILFPNVAEMEKLRDGGFDLDNDDWGISYTILSANLASCVGPVLHVLECCSAGGSGISSRKANHEILAASCTTDPGRRRGSWIPSGHFSRALMHHVTNMVQQYGYFSVAELHATMASEGGKGVAYLTTQPWYFKGFGKQAIILSPLSRDPKAPAKRKNPQQNEDQVLFVVHMQKDKAVAGDLYKWLTSDSRPEWVTYVQMCGYYHAGSTDIHLSCPISLYSSLPESTGITFSGYVKSTNLLLSRTARLRDGIPETSVGCLTQAPQQQRLQPPGHQYSPSPSSQHGRSSSFQGGFSPFGQGLPRQRPSPSSSSFSMQENLPPPGSSRQSSRPSSSGAQSSSGGRIDLSQRLEQTQIDPRNRQLA